MRLIDICGSAMDDFVVETRAEASLHHYSFEKNDRLVDESQDLAQIRGWQGAAFYLPV